MRLVTVKSIPKDSRKDVEKVEYRHDLIKMLEKFLISNKVRVRVLNYEGEYANTKSCRDSIQKCIRHKGYPIKVITRKDKIFLEKTENWREIERERRGL